MKRIPLLLFTLFLGGLAFAQSPDGKLHPARTVVAGRIKNLQPSDGRVVTVNYCDPLEDADKVAREVNADGSFHTEYPMAFAQNITIQYGGEFINLFAQPSDSVYVEIDMDKYRNGGFDGVTASGSNSGLNKYLPAFYDYMCSLPIPEFDNSLPPGPFTDSLKAYLEKGYAAIDRYAQEKKLPAGLVDWGKRDLKYAYANYILDYAEKDPQVRLKVFTDPLFDLYNLKGFRSMMFPYHVRATADVMLKANPDFMTAANQTKDSGRMFEIGLEQYRKLPASLTRDYMLYSFLQRMLRFRPDLVDSIPSGVFSDGYFLEKLREKAVPSVPQYKGIALKGVSYLDAAGKAQTVPQGDIIAYLAKKYPGKVLYIDVYATWCGPCRAEFPSARELHKLFVGKDVVFVNLCLASESGKWLQTVRELRIEGENYFLDADATGLFMSAYGLTGYPSYLLADKSGRVVDTKAPRPSNLTLAADKINSLLK